MKTNLILITSIFTVACTTGDNYPTKYATVTCETMYACIDNGLIESILSYDNQEDCIASTEEDVRESDDFSDFTDGNKDFQKDAAESCLGEIEEVQSESECDGDMNPITYIQDIASEDCSEVYE